MAARPRPPATPERSRRHHQHVRPRCRKQPAHRRQARLGSHGTPRPSATESAPAATRSAANHHRKTRHRGQHREPPPARYGRFERRAHLAGRRLAARTLSRHARSRRANRRTCRAAMLGSTDTHIRHALNPCGNVQAAFVRCPPLRQSSLHPQPAVF